MIEGRLIGTILGGQVLTAAPIDEEYRKIATEIGVDEEGYVEAVHEVQKLSRERIEAAANVLFIVANNISNTAYHHLKLKSVADTLTEQLSQISATMEQLAASASVVNENQTNLNTEIKKVNVVTGKIDSVMDFIKEIGLIKENGELQTPLCWLVLLSVQCLHLLLQFLQLPFLDGNPFSISLALLDSLSRLVGRLLLGIIQMNILG